MWNAGLGEVKKAREKITEIFGQNPVEPTAPAWTWKLSWRVLSFFYFQKAILHVVTVYIMHVLNEVKISHSRFEIESYSIYSLNTCRNFRGKINLFSKHAERNANRVCSNKFKILDKELIYVATFRVENKSYFIFIIIWWKILYFSSDCNTFEWFYVRKDLFSHKNVKVCQISKVSPNGALPIRL